jgi:glycosyltransferase involved in cell wall biosynthesis
MMPRTEVSVPEGSPGAAMEADATPQVSVVIPTHDRSGLLALALRSALSQLDVELEVIVVDDGSTDDTSGVVAGFGDPRIRLIRHDVPQGVSAARNRGIAEARGAWIAFLDDDDLWAPEKLASQLQAARSTDRSWVYVGSVNVSASHRVVGGKPPLPPEQLMAQLHESNVVPGGCSGVMVAREALISAGVFDPSLSLTADWDLWLRLATNPPACVSRPLVAYRVHAGNRSLDADRGRAEFRIVGDRYGGANSAILYRYLGWWSLRAKKRRKALGYFVWGVVRRNARYPVREFGRDLAYLARDTLDALGLRLSVPSPERRLRPQSAEVKAWTTEGQRWVDQLLAAAIDPGPLHEELG